MFLVRCSETTNDRPSIFKKNIEMSMISLGRKKNPKPMSPLFSTMTISTEMSTLRCTAGPGWLSKMWHWWSCVCWAARLCYYPTRFLETTPPDVLTVEGSHVHICFVWMHNAQYIHCCFCSASCCRAAPNFQSISLWHFKIDPLFLLYMSPPELLKTYESLFKMKRLCYALWNYISL